VQDFPVQRDTLVEQAEAYVKRNGAISVPSLFEALKPGNPSLTEEQLPDLVSRLQERGSVDVKDYPPATESLGDYLRMWERNLSLYVSLAVALSTVLAIYAVPVDSPLVASRWILGSVFVLFIPGYVAVEALFPEGRELDLLERLALSVGLSLALVPLVGLLLNYTPWGIRLTPIVISLFIVTVGLSLVGFVRRFTISLASARSNQVQD
jgi:uncharacterized membrane protein